MSRVHVSPEGVPQRDKSMSRLPSADIFNLDIVVTGDEPSGRDLEGAVPSGLSGWHAKSTNTESPSDPTVRRHGGRASSTGQPRDTVCDIGSIWNVA